MIRFALACIAGFTAWTVLWLAGNAFLFPGATEISKSGRRLDDFASLVGLLALSFVCSFAAGAVSSALGKSKATSATLVTAVLLLVTGISVQAFSWALFPTWYHLTFLGALVPFTLAADVLLQRLKKKPA